MSKVLGTIITGVVVNENEKSVFVQKDGITYRLDKDESETALQLGTLLKVSYTRA